MATSSVKKLKQILRKAKKLSCEYYSLTQKPLGVTGEVAEYEAAQKLGLKLMPARNPGYDAVKRKGKKIHRYQIKGRAVSSTKKYVGRVPKIAITQKFNSVLLVLLDKATLDAVEIWEASRSKVRRVKTNKHGQMNISKFKSIAYQTWPAER